MINGGKQSIMEGWIHVLLYLTFTSSFKTMDLITRAECGVTTLVATPHDSAMIHHEQTTYCTIHHWWNYTFQSNATHNELTLGIGFLVCNGDFTTGGGGLDGGAGRGGGCPNLVPTSGPSSILAGSPKISSPGLLTSNHTTSNLILTNGSKTKSTIRKSFLDLTEVLI